MRKIDKHDGELSVLYYTTPKDPIPSNLMAPYQPQQIIANFTLWLYCGVHNCVPVSRGRDLWLLTLSPHMPWVHTIVVQLHLEAMLCLSFWNPMPQMSTHKHKKWKTVLSQVCYRYLWIGHVSFFITQLVRSALYRGIEVISESWVVSRIMCIWTAVICCLRFTWDENPNFTIIVMKSRESSHMFLNFRVGEVARSNIEQGIWSN